MLVVGCAYFVAADIEEPLQGFDLHEYVYRIVSQKMRKSETTDANPVPICLFVDQYFNLCKRESGWRSAWQVGIQTTANVRSTAHT